MTLQFSINEVHYLHAFLRYSSVPMILHTHIMVYKGHLIRTTFEAVSFWVKNYWPPQCFLKSVGATLNPTFATR